MTKKTYDRSLLTRIPKVDSILSHPSISSLSSSIPGSVIKGAVREELDSRRREVLSGRLLDPDGLSVESVVRASVKRAVDANRPNLRPVINATGVVVHTNLGRSPLPDEAIREMEHAARGYSTLEYNLATGQRGSRDDLVEEILCRLTGAEAATVVNNNAAAVMLLLHTFARGRAVMVSRGELVEIGGSFRIPDVMEASGARLIEVGTTNRTRISDFRKRAGEDVSLLLKVHTSNYRIVGFTEEVPVRELAGLGKEMGVPVAVDLGSGSLAGLGELGIKHHEPTVAQVLREGADIVSFSGDKLLGGPQAGIVVGRQAYVDPMKKNPMKRALRVGKLTLSSLESVLRIYLDPGTAARRIPTLGMISASKGSVAARARRFAGKIRDLPVRISFLPSVSRVGGGSLPLEELPTMLLALDPEGISADRFDETLRRQDPPVVARIVDDRVCLDLRTVSSRELSDLEKGIRGALQDTETLRHRDTEKEP
jgi:L-seryl-tRNA(Ser) seleniumtransferase